MDKKNFLTGHYKDITSEFPLLAESLLGNSILAWCVFLLTGVFLYLLTYFVIHLMLGKIRRLHEKFSSTFFDVLHDVFEETTRLSIFTASFYAATIALTLSTETREVLKSIAVTVLLIQAGMWVSEAGMIVIRRYFKARYGDNPSFLSTLGLFKLTIRTAVWGIVFLLVLDNFGVDITALIAGLGVGGIAVALAVQNILGDLIASLSIILDKPFEVGDFIIVDDLLGTVEHIGIKTTRVRSLSGEQLVFANSDLLSSRVRNFKRMYERRIVFKIGVTYQTPSEKLKIIPDMIKAALERHEEVRFDRSHFQGFGDFSLNFETVYYVLKPDYNLYMDIQQAINLELYEKFEAEGIEFAYPTQTLFIEKPGEEAA